MREVWYWRKGRIAAHALRGERYVKITKSEVLPDRPTTSRATREYRQALRKKQPKRVKA